LHHITTSGELRHWRGLRRSGAQAAVSPHQPRVEA
jgi:hypothetical protein